MSHNSFGHLFRVTTFGESHGPAIGCVVDGCPPGIPLTEADIQPWLDRRKPGQSKYVTQRKEPDQVRILSGVFQDERMAGQLTTGTPIALVIDNVDARSIVRVPIWIKAARIVTPPYMRSRIFRAIAPAATRVAVSRADCRPPPR